MALVLIVMTTTMAIDDIDDPCADSGCGGRTCGDMNTAFTAVMMFSRFTVDGQRSLRKKE